MEKIIFIAAFALTFSFMLVQTSAACVDEYSQCSEFVQFCHLKGQWENYMKKYCKGSCPGHCDEVKRPEPTLPTMTEHKREQQKQKTTSHVTSKQDSSKKCGSPNVYHNDVAQSTYVKQGSWPWVVSLTVAGSGRHFCGGSLISTRWVLTSASCLHNMDRGNIEIVAGEKNRFKSEGTEQYRRVRMTVTHPDYKPSRYENDLALLELESPVKLNSMTKVVCLPPEGKVPGVGTQCYFSGWGTMSEYKLSLPLMHQAKLPVVQNEYCFRNRNHICVGQQKSVLSNACRGDRGGPLVCKDSTGKWTQHGVAGYLTRHCENYAAFTRVSSQSRWISYYVTA